MRAPIATAVVIVATAACATTTERAGLPPLRTVEHVELQRYLGTWYEIASFPQAFQRGCTATTASYSLNASAGEHQEVRVENRCRADTLDGPGRRAVGRARVVDASETAKLEVSFFGPFWGAYWVIDLAPDYSYAVVGHPSRDYLWVLSRTPELAPATYDAILERLRAQHYDLTRLQRTLQASAPSAEASSSG